MKFYFKTIHFYNLAQAHVIFRLENVQIQTTFQIANTLETKVIHFMQAVTYRMKGQTEDKVVCNRVD